MTRSGVLFLQHPWEPITAETASSSWPTPVASDAWTTDLKSSQVKEGSMHSVSLGRAVQMWPTPTTQETEHPEAVLTETGRRLSKDGKTSHSLGLADAVNMWPTPTYGKLAGGTGAFNQIEEKYLNHEISLEEKKAMQAGNGGKLNPTWVEWLMGFPEGWTDLEDSETP
jgi:DNA (cytosine-5)-methyltransferase 1